MSKKSQPEAYYKPKCLGFLDLKVLHETKSESQILPDQIKMVIYRSLTNSRDLKTRVANYPFAL